MGAPLTERAPAKVNLTLRVLRRRPDGYHDIESLVAFADEGDTLTLTPFDRLRLSVQGSNATAAGAEADNLVLKAAAALSARVPGLVLGDFTLDKTLPVAAGLGGGSADAAAALRLLARGNAIAPDDERLMDAACAVGADVPVCLDARARFMRGIGHDLSPPVKLPPLPAVLVNPGVALPTREVFAALSIPPSSSRDTGEPPADAPEFRNWLAAQGNDLEKPAIALRPVIADVLGELRELDAIARMSGSGATCFGVFPSLAAAKAAALTITRKHPQWWVSQTGLR